MTIDEVDRRVLRALQELPEAPIVEIAERAGLSHTPCWRRMKRLEADGIIIGKVVLLNARKLGWSISVFAHLKIQRHDEDTLEAFERAVCAHPEIVECFSMSGESDYLMRILARSIDDYERFLKKVLLHLPGVGAVNSSFALKPIKMTTNLPV